MGDPAKGGKLPDGTPVYDPSVAQKMYPWESHPEDVVFFHLMSQVNDCCYNCKYGSGGCNWSDSLEPVPGWTAYEYEYVRMNSHNNIKTNEDNTEVAQCTKIVWCPQYDPDIKAQVNCYDGALRLLGTIFCGIREELEETYVEYMKYHERYKDYKLPSVSDFDADSLESLVSDIRKMTTIIATIYSLERDLTSENGKDIRGIIRFSRNKTGYIQDKEFNKKVRRWKRWCDVVADTKEADIQFKREKRHARYLRDKERKKANGN